MGGERREIGDDNGEQGGRRPPAISIGWQIFAIVAVSTVFLILAKLLTRALGIAANLDVALLALVGFLLAAVMVPVGKPRSAKQLCLMVAVVAAGGTLAMLTYLAVKTVAFFLDYGWDLWGDAGWHLWVYVFGMVLASGIGAGFIILSYFYLGVLHRPTSPEDRR